MSRLIEGLDAAPHNGKLLTPGVSFVHTSPDRPELAFKGTQRTRNDFRAIKHNLDPDHLSTLFGNESHCGHAGNIPYANFNTQEGKVATVGQPSPYSRRSILVVAESEKQLATRNKEVETIFPAQLAPDIRLAYTASILAGLQTAYKIAEDGTKALAIEHLTPDVSRITCQYPRSVPLPHATIGVIDDALTIPQEVRIDHLRAEQRALNPNRMKWLAARMSVGLSKSLRESEFDPNKISMRIKSGEAKGYEILFNISPEELTDPENIKLVTLVLDTEHKIYEIISKKLLSGLPDVAVYNGVQYYHKPQPASRDIMYIDRGNLVKRKSPILYSHAGGLEELGVILDRSPDHQVIHKDEVVELFRRDAGRNIDNAISSLGLSRVN